MLNDTTLIRETPHKQYLNSQRIFDNDIINIRRQRNDDHVWP